MPTLNINGRRVTVGDGFLKLSPEEQNDTVDEIARSLGTEPFAEQPPKRERNFFDQFDEPAPKRNFFEQFNEPSPAAPSRTGW